MPIILYELLMINKNNFRFDYCFGLIRLVEITNFYYLSEGLLFQLTLSL